MTFLSDNVFLVIVFLFLTALTFTAIFNKNKWLRIVTVIVLNLCILLREYSIYYFVRNYNFANNVSEDFSNGAHFVVDYCYASSIPILIALLFITILCIRGFNQSADNQTKTESL